MLSTNLIAYLFVLCGFTKCFVNGTVSNNTEAGKKIDPSLVFSWEKCGVLSKVRITKLFMGTHNEDQLLVIYDPAINSLIFETTIDSKFKQDFVQVYDYTDTFLFKFDNSEKITVITDCHGRPRVPLEWSSKFLANPFEYKTFKNVSIFNSYDDAREKLDCRNEVRFKVGNIVHFPNVQSTLDDHLLFTLINQKTIYSVTYANQTLTIWSSDGVLSYIDLLKPIQKTGLYATYDKDVLQFYASCPLNNELIGQWKSNIFDFELQLESSKRFFIGSAITDSFLKSFCAVDKYTTLEEDDEKCVTISDISNDMEFVQNSNELYHYYLPTEEEMYKIQLILSLNKISAASLVTISRPTFTIASRSYAPPKFFARSMSEYLNGFTDGNLNFWTGLSTLETILAKKKYGLRIEFEHNGDIYFEEYDQIKIGNSSENYALRLTRPSPGRQDLFAQNNQPFSAVDFNNRNNVATTFSGAFWFLPNVIAWTSVNYYYCFSCENRVDSSGTAVYVRNSEIFPYVTRMQLLF